MYQILAVDDEPPLKGRGQGHITHFLIPCPQLYLRNGWSKSRQILCAGRMYQMLAFG